ncbi:hypothetical protein PBI_SHEAKEIRA_44 [Mycobacterium phage SheaKeira]|nr:hypothetical protein PBI_SHEAKEIRA_44 [Mycobacterium phage SheaKeira]
MAFEVSNAHADLRGQVRLTIDTSYENALEILSAAYDIHNRPDPILEALMRSTRGGVIPVDQVREDLGIKE